MADKSLNNSDNRIYFFIAAILSIFVPAPGRFAYAIMLLLLFNIQIATVTLFFHFITFLKLEKFKNILLLLELIFVTILFKQFLIAFCPIMALTLGFCIYLPALSTVAIQFFFEHHEKIGVKKNFIEKMSKILMFSAYALVFFLLREVMGYATISLPSFGELIVFHLPVSESLQSTGKIFATIPGSLFLIAILFAIFIFINNKFTIVKNARKIKEEK